VGIAKPINASLKFTSGSAAAGSSAAVSSAAGALGAAHAMNDNTITPIIKYVNILFISFSSVLSI
jgi:hypothetical protein